MTFALKKVLRMAGITAILVAAPAARAEYLSIHLKVYGLDCEVCARGVSASVGRLPGIESVNVSLKTGLLEIVLTRGNTFKLSDLRKRIKENGFRSMEATVTAVGRLNGSKFEVSGTGESYDLGKKALNSAETTELTFDVH
jgi:copper chaperone CopZ